MIFFFKLIIVPFFISFYLIKWSIKISNLKNLFDSPNEIRKLHKINVPNLGGIAIYTSYIFTIFLFFPNLIDVYNFNILLCSTLLIFGIGLKDDLIGLSPHKKLFIQIIASLIFLINTDYKIINLYGFFGIYELNYTFSIILCMLFMVFLTNAINLIDGINGLAGTVSVFTLLYLSYLFFKIKQETILLFLIPLIFCLVAFLYFNYGNAKIFMGNCGSYFLGFIISIFCLIYISKPKNYIFQIAQINLIFSILFFPIFDTIRIFIFRIYSRKSPFLPDTSHLHHLLLKLRLNHFQINFQIQIFTIILFSINLFLMSYNSLLVFFLNLFLISVYYFIILKKIKKY